MQKLSILEMEELKGESGINSDLVIFMTCANVHSFMATAQSSANIDQFVWWLDKSDKLGCSSLGF